MTIREAVAKGTRTLESASVPEAAYDARTLALFVLKWSFTEYSLRRNDQADPFFLHVYEELIKRRAERIPLQYITGEAPFFGHTFYVTPDVLIPRYDTETLVETALTLLGQTKGEADVLDMCTGSGCVPISIMMEHREGVRCTGADISRSALHVARKNAEKMHVEVLFLLSDLFQTVSGEYDIITANPPYIRPDVIETLDPEVRDHEPHLALDGGEDGLAFYRRIARDARGHLKEDAFLLMEIGADQAEDVISICRGAGYSSCEVKKDLSGRDRVAVARI
ncbi:MAG: peptide chain release factor N(5)-glutamine methyltransferase [Lachnospiraceae bacterium]|nr:peptide chain release factor N(5)-glutamine methyltransferase [Lachnospiraceae bacterium]